MTIFFCETTLEKQKYPSACSKHIFHLDVNVWINFYNYHSFQLFINKKTEFLRNFKKNQIERNYPKSPNYQYYLQPN